MFLGWCCPMTILFFSRSGLKSPTRCVVFVPSSYKHLQATIGSYCHAGRNTDLVPYQRQILRILLVASDNDKCVAGDFPMWGVLLVDDCRGWCCPIYWGLSSCMNWESVSASQCNGIIEVLNIDHATYFNVFSLCNKWWLTNLSRKERHGM